ncbi:MAG TPA: class IV adenylate cyclase [Gemmatimonadota bacterium]|nr:class IV adenylate cyclase [Gemmatimonadota bacterium]
MTGTSPERVLDGVNLELKARVDDPAALRERVRGTGAALQGTEEQVDRYFRVPAGRLKLRESTLDGAHLIFYVRPEDGPVRRARFHRLPVEAAEPLAETLSAMLGAESVVEKTREVWWHDDVRIHLDRVAGLGDFLELEARVDRIGSRAEAAARLERLVLDLAVRPADVLGGSYGEMA